MYLVCYHIPKYCQYTPQYIFTKLIPTIYSNMLKEYVSSTSRVFYQVWKTDVKILFKPEMVPGIFLYNITIQEFGFK